LRVDDIDLEHRILTVRQGKGKKDRQIPLVDNVVKALRNYLRYRNTQIIGCSSATTLIMNRLKFGGQKFSKCPNMIRQSGGHARGLMAPLGLDQSRGM